MSIDEYITKRRAIEPKFNAVAFAHLVKLSPSQVSRLRSRASRPSWDTIEAIHKATNGAVTINDWRTVEVRA